MGAHIVNGKEIVSVVYSSPEGDVYSELAAYYAFQAAVFQEYLKAGGESSSWAAVLPTVNTEYEGGYPKKVSYTVNSPLQARTLVSISRSLYL